MGGGNINEKSRCRRWGFINYHYKSVAYKTAKEATTNVVVKLMNQLSAISLIDLADKLNQTEKEENEDLSVDTEDKKWFNSFVS